jgi:hypothetical protein
MIGIGLQTLSLRPRLSTNFKVRGPSWSDNGQGYGNLTG